MPSNHCIRQHSFSIIFVSIISAKKKQEKQYRNRAAANNFPSHQCPDDNSTSGWFTLRLWSQRDLDQFWPCRIIAVVVLGI